MTDDENRTAQAAPVGTTPAVPAGLDEAGAEVPAGVRTEVWARWVRRLAGCVPLAALFLFAYRGLIDYDPAARSHVDLRGSEEFFFSPADSDPTLIFALTALLLYQRRHDILRSARHASSPLIGAAFLLPASVLCLWSHHVAAPELLIPSLGLLLMGAGAVWGGVTGLRVLSVPALFVLLAYRPPGVLVNEFMYPMQLFTAESTQWILNFVGINTWTSGDLIFSRERIFQVIETCAGLRSILTLVMAAVIYVEIMGCPRLRAGIIVAASPLLGVVINQARVVSIVLNPVSALASVHTLQGVAMIVVGVLLIAALDAILVRSLQPGFRAWASAADAWPLPPGSRLRLGALALLLASLGVATWRVPAWEAPTSETVHLHRFPAALDGWQGSGRKIEKEFLGSAGVSQWTHRLYTRGDREVGVLLATDDRLDPRVSMLSPKTHMLGSGWLTIAERPMGLGDNNGEDTHAIEVTVQRSPQAAALVYHWYEGVAPATNEILRGLLVLDRGPWRRPGPAFFVRLTTPLDPDHPELAEATLNGFLPLVREGLAHVRDSAS